MRQFLIKIGVFSVFATIFYIVVMPIWAHIMPPFMAKNVRNCVGCYGHLFSRVKDAEQVKNPDILFIGSSHSYRGFDTRVFAQHGIKAFNLGSSSQTPLNSKVLLKQYLDKINPKMVVIEAYTGTLTSDGVESSLDILSNNKIDGNSVKMAWDIHQLTTYNTLLYGYFRQILDFNKNFTEPQKQGGDYYIKGGGFVESEFRKNPLLDEPVGKWEINPKQIQALKENINFLKAKNIPYLIVQAPITEKLYHSKANNQEVNALLSSLGTYKNFQGEIPLNDTLDFYDNNHLNQPAVVRFNEYFIKYFNLSKK